MFQAEAISGCSVHSVEDAKLAAIKLLSLGIESIIITLGADGAVYSTKTSQEHIPTVKVTPVDSTVR